MNINTSRFGIVELAEDDILNFPEGMLGFNTLRKFVLLDDPNNEIFAWLQSCEEPDIAFPVLEPELFAADYQIHISKSDLLALNLEDQSKSKCFLIITIPNDPTQMTANFKAPIVINIDQRIAKQCVLQDNNLAIREPIFIRLQQRIIQTPLKESPLKSDNIENIAPPIPLKQSGSEEGADLI